MGQGESGGDGGLVSADADGEGVQLGLIIGFHVDSQFSRFSPVRWTIISANPFTSATRRSGAGSGTGCR
jgi:hypothetical protein